MANGTDTALGTGVRIWVMRCVDCGREVRFERRGGECDLCGRHGAVAWCTCWCETGLCLACCYGVNRAEGSGQHTCRYGLAREVSE